MDKNKIAIIMCVNNDLYFDECMYYLNKLNIPEGYQVDLYDVRDAESIYAGYNEAMEASDAKYKLYIHQDMFLLDPDILQKSISFFESHPKCGLLGLIGGDKKPDNRLFYLAWNKGKIIFSSNDVNHMKLNNFSSEDSKVFAVDGMFMMTQYDLPWRSDVLDGWDMYDFSQSLEFQKAGYEVWVPGQEMPWALHDCGRLSVANYDRRLEKFLSVYKADFDTDAILAQPLVYPEENRKKQAMMMELKENLKTLLTNGLTKEVLGALSSAFDIRFYDTELLYIAEIASNPVYKELIEKSSSYKEIYEGFLRKRFDTIRTTDYYALIKAGK